MSVKYPLVTTSVPFQRLQHYMKVLYGIEVCCTPYSSSMILWYCALRLEVFEQYFRKAWNYALHILFYSFSHGNCLVTDKTNQNMDTYLTVMLWLGILDLRVLSGSSRTTAWSPRSPTSQASQDSHDEDNGLPSFPHRVSHRKEGQQHYWN